MNTFVLYYILGNVGGQIYFFSREREPPKVSILRVFFLKLLEGETRERFLNSKRNMS
jgi:hypothetical protein